MTTVRGAAASQTIRSSLRFRTFVLLALTMAAVALTAYGVVHQNTRHELNALDRDTLQREAGWATQIMDQSASQLGHVTRAWDRWLAVFETTDAASPAGHISPGAIDALFTPDNFAANHLSLAFMFNAAGEITDAQIYDPTTGTLSDPPSAITNGLAPHQALITQALDGTPSEGALTIGDSLYIVTVQPRADSGAWILGRAVDQRFVDNALGALSTQITVVSPNSPVWETDLEQAQEPV